MGIILFPFVWTLISSFQTQKDLTTLPPWPWKPSHWTTYNYRLIFSNNDFVTSIGTSFLVAVTIVVILLTVGTVGAYALARLRFRGRNTLFNFILVVYMLPAISLLIPIVIVLKNFHLVDTIPGVILAHTVIAVPMMTWFMVGMFEGIPKDLEDAAQVDGHTKLGALRRVILPLSISGVALLSVFIFILSWNELMFARVVTFTSVKMMQPMILYFLSPTAFYTATVCAAGIISSLPVVLLAIILQRYIISGIMKGAIK